MEARVDVARRPHCHLQLWEEEHPEDPKAVYQREFIEKNTARRWTNLLRTLARFRLPRIRDPSKVTDFFSIRFQKDELRLQNLGPLARSTWPQQTWCSFRAGWC